MTSQPNVALVRHIVGNSQTRCVHIYCVAVINNPAIAKQQQYQAYTHVLEACGISQTSQQWVSTWITVYGRRQSLASQPELSEHGSTNACSEGS